MKKWSLSYSDTLNITEAKKRIVSNLKYTQWWSELDKVRQTISWLNYCTALVVEPPNSALQAHSSQTEPPGLMIAPRGPSPATASINGWLGPSGVLLMTIMLRLLEVKGFTVIEIMTGYRPFCKQSMILTDHSLPNGWPNVHGCRKICESTEQKLGLVTFCNHASTMFRSNI